MEETDTLLGIGEISIAFAGFSGIAAALRTRGEFHPWDVWRTLLMLFNSLGAVIFSLLPLALYQFGIAGTTLWQVSSLAIVLYAILCMPVSLHYKPREFAEPLVSRRLQPLFWAFVVICFLGHAANAPFLGLFSVYFLGLLLSVVMACLQFGAIVVIRPPA